MKVRLMSLDGSQIAEISIPDDQLPVGAVTYKGRVFVFHGRMIDAMCAYDEARAYTVRQN